eukprot:gene15145-17775_t
MRNPQPELERSSTLRQVEAMDAMLTEPDNGAPPQSIRPLSSEEARTVLSQYNPVFEQMQASAGYNAWTFLLIRTLAETTGAITGASEQASHQRNGDHCARDSRASSS